MALIGVLGWIAWRQRRLEQWQGLFEDAVHEAFGRTKRNVEDGFHSHKKAIEALTRRKQ